MDWPVAPVSKDDAGQALERYAFARAPDGREERCVELVTWLVFLDDPGQPIAVEERRTLTMAKIIDRARQALGADRRLVHAFLGPFGADHDLEYALEMVDKADEVFWETQPIHHDLAVRVGEHVYRYDVPRPERGGKEWG